jgi:hypothetical protein
MARYISVLMNGRSSQQAALLLSLTGTAELFHPAIAVSRQTGCGMGWFAQADGSVVWHGGIEAILFLEEIAIG